MGVMSTADEAFVALVAQVREVFFALRGISNAMLEDLELTAVERSVLVELVQQGPQTVPTLAEGRAVSRQAMQKVVDRMLERDLLALEPNPRHQRSVLIKLAKKGEKCVGEIRTRERALLKGAHLPIAEPELTRATHTLQALATFLNHDVRR
jgi:DNA-binding MarR family transcriptional regulator